MFEIRVTKLDNQESNVKGLVSMVVDGKFAFSSMRVIESEKRREDFLLQCHHTGQRKESMWICISRLHQI